MQSVAPAVGAKNAAGDTAVVAVIANADTQVATNTVQMTLDGNAVVPVLTANTNGVTVTYAPPVANLFAPLSTHNVQLKFSDTGTPAAQVTTNWSFTVLNYGTLPPSFAQPDGAVDTTASGFRMRFAQVDATTYGALPGTVANAEAMLAGVLADPATGALYPNAATAGTLADGGFAITNVLNFSFEASDQGNFTSANGATDSLFPGLTGADADNAAAEVITYLQLPAGYYRMGVSSADGFRVTAGLNPRDALSPQLGIFDTRRITQDSTFDFAATQTGFYGFRLVWFHQSKLPDNGSSQASLEFYTVTPTGTKILVNDLANPQAIKAYRTSSAAVAPYVKYAGPTAFISDYRGGDFGVTNVQIQISDGTTTKVSASTVALTIDGQAVTPTVTTANGITTVLDVPAPPQLPRTVHKAKLVFGAAGAAPQTVSWQFNSLRNYVLPAPIYSENFDATTEGTFPTGWVEENHTGSQHPGLDPTDLQSDFYLGWVVIGDDVAPNKVKGVAPNQVLNGQVFDPNTNPLLNGHYLYAESDDRQNGPPGQIQYLTTPSYDLTSKPGIAISFTSSYEQNQDALACLEVSADGGTNWSPVFYWLQGDADTQAPPDILRDANGNVDAVASLTTSYGDVARYTDSTGKQVGGYYGFFIKAPITQALAPYLEGRINDDGAESKRIEVFRVPQADGQKNVKFRFVQAGTSSWYWGVDNWSIYSIPAFAAPPPSGQPAELGETVNGYQDDFSGLTRNTNWVVLGTGGDHYLQTNGLLQVSVNAGDPNHLVYSPSGGYSTNTQEILARVRVAAFGVDGDAQRGGIAVGVTTNTAASPPPWNNQGGINLELRDNTADGNEGATQTQRKVKFLDDLRSWGPAGLQTTWLNNVWYWMRLRLAAKEDGTNSVFAKFWIADGQTPEPTDWQMKWGTASPALQSPIRFGYAGVTGCSGGGLGQFEVSYVLIKADGLPSITANWAPLGPPLNPIVFRDITHSTNKVNIDYFGGVLQSAGTVTNPWVDVSGAASPFAVTAVANAQRLYRQREQDIEFTAWMTGDREVPAVTTSGAGFGVFRLNANALFYDIQYSGLSAPATAAHIHGATNSTGTASPLFTFTSVSGTSGRIRGRTTISDPTILAAIQAGQAYVNIHTTNNAAGEIRGQLTPVVLHAALTGAADGVTTTASGAAELSLVGNTLTWHVSYSGLSGPPTGAHIHGPAAAGTSAGVIIPFTNVPAATSGVITGSTTITNTAYLGYIVDGLTYVNLHTSAHAGGEIRGQIGP